MRTHWWWPVGWMPDGRRSTRSRDPLRAVIRPLPVPTHPDFTALPVGLRADGQRWTLRLAGTHVLVRGAGAGKGALIWSLLRALASAIHAGTVQAWAVDTGGALGVGAPLFARRATDAGSGIRLLELAASAMSDRALRLTGQARPHRPSDREPLLVVLVDDLAALTAQQADTELRDRAERALTALAAQGSAGVVVLAAVHDAGAGPAHLFPTRIAICSAGEQLPGLAQVEVEGLSEPLRVRASYLTGADITELAGRYPAPVVRAPGFMKMVA